MRVRIWSELDLLKVNEAITSFDDDIIQSLWCFVFIITFKFHAAIARRCIKPIAQDLKALTILINITSCSDGGFLNIFTHSIKGCLVRF
ncbi:hypothetical protein A9P93_14870 [Klebsiella pneumoniae]|nr:hypothetical protein A9P93_14870 [Klebsiella pneumoniae]